MPALLTLALLSATPATREKLLVLEVVASDDSIRRTARLVEEQVLTELAHADRYEVLGQSELGAVLGLERQRQLLGCADDQGSCVAELGGAMGARWVVMGSLGRFGSKLRLDLKLIDARSGRAERREGKVLDHEDELFPAVSAIVTALLDLRSDEGKTPAAPARVGPWVLTGGGLAVTLVGVLGIVLPLQWSTELQGNVTRGDVTAPEARSKLGLFQALYVGGVVLSVVGAAMVAGGLAWYFRGPAEPSTSLEPKVSFVLLPGGAVAGVAFSW